MVPPIGFCNPYIFIKLRVSVNKSWLLDKNRMLDKQTVGMFPWQPPKFRFFCINPIILKKTLFKMFINQFKKC